MNKAVGAAMALAICTICQHPASAQYFQSAQPEQQPALSLHAGAVKLPWLAAHGKVLPKMSEASAVRMACGVADVSMFQRQQYALKPVVVQARPLPAYTNPGILVQPVLTRPAPAEYITVSGRVLIKPTDRNALKAGYQQTWHSRSRSAVTAPAVAPANAPVAPLPPPLPLPAPAL